jgi:predicted nucleic acid-binding protein
MPDPGDEMVLETAVNGNANAIVTFNQRHFEEATMSFHCAVILPRAALRRIRSSHP